MILNYGHTIGHALEIACPLSHGEAVAIGMVAAGSIAETEVGFTEAERQRAAISRLGLPVSAPEAASPSEIEALIGMDKKRDRQGSRMVLLEEIGRPVVVHVSERAVAAGLASIGVG